MSQQDVPTEPQAEVPVLERLVELYHHLFEQQQNNAPISPHVMTELNAIINKLNAETPPEPTPEAPADDTSHHRGRRR